MRFSALDAIEQQICPDAAHLLSRLANHRQRGMKNVCKFEIIEADHGDFFGYRYANIDAGNQDL